MADISKLLQQISGPYRLLCVKKHSLAIKEGNIMDKGSIHHVLLSSPRAQVTDKPSEEENIRRRGIETDSDNAIVRR